MGVTQQEYKDIKNRVEKAEKILEHKFLSNDPKIKGWVREYEKLTAQMLDYEIEHDLLPL